MAVKIQYDLFKVFINPEKKESGSGPVGEETVREEQVGTVLHT